MRRVNEVVAEQARRDGGSVAFVCECGQCGGKLVRTTLHAYDLIRARDGLILASGHLNPTATASQIAEGVSNSTPDPDVPSGWLTPPSRLVTRPRRLGVGRWAFPADDPGNGSGNRLSGDPQPGSPT